MEETSLNFQYEYLYKTSEGQATKKMSWSCRCSHLPPETRTLKLCYLFSVDIALDQLNNNLILLK